MFQQLGSFYVPTANIKTTKLLEHKNYQTVGTQKLPSCWNIKTIKLLEHKNYQTVGT
jgi:hypothetical protein